MGISQTNKPNAERYKRETLSRCLDRLNQTQFNDLISSMYEPKRQDELTTPLTKYHFLDDVERWKDFLLLETTLREKWATLLSVELAELQSLRENETSVHIPKEDDQSLTSQSIERNLVGLLGNNQYPFLEFTNRTDEMQTLTYSSMSPYHIVDAPAKYGKTYLLNRLKDFYEHKSWKSIYISLQDLDERTILSVTRKILISLDIKENQVPNNFVYLSSVELGTWLGDTIKESSSCDYSGIIIFFDLESLWVSLEALFTDLFANFIPALESALRGFQDDSYNPFRVIVSGRHLRHKIGNELSESLPWAWHRLTPFKPRDVKNSVIKYLAISNDEDSAMQIMAHVMHFTSGHPGCMALVLKMFKEQKLKPDDFFKKHADEILKRIVYREANDVYINIPIELNKYLEFLSVFRCLNYPVLKKWLEETRAHSVFFENNFEDEIDLADKLSESDLMDWDHDLLRDNITRRLLVMRLLTNSPKQFELRCQQAQKIYLEYIEETTDSRSHMWAIEAMFQFLQRHSSCIDNEIQRKKIKNEFFNETIPAILMMLSKSIKPAKASYEALKRALADDWEFQFTVNYYLRANQYNSQPYKEFLQKINNFYISL